MQPSLSLKAWIVYAKPPFASPEYVFRYLGRQTHRVAISNQRILAVDNGHEVIEREGWSRDPLVRAGSWS